MGKKEGSDTVSPHKKTSLTIVIFVIIGLLILAYGVYQAIKKESPATYTDRLKKEVEQDLNEAQQKLQEASSLITSMIAGGSS